MKKKSLLRVVPFFLALACAVPLTLQAAAVPNLIGTWTITTASGVTYEDVLTQSATPTFFSGAPSSYMYITNQQGRVFAGYSMDGTTIVYLVGVISLDNSITMQAHNTNGTSIIGGKYSVINGKQWFKGYMQTTSRLYGDPPSAFIEAAYFEIKKTSSSLPAR